MKRHATLLLCAALAFVSATAFAGGAGEKATTPPATGSAPAASALPLVTPGSATLTFACIEGWYSAVSINNGLPIWQEFEKRTGVKVKFQAYEDYDTAMQPRIAAGTELPDLMVIPPSWGNRGVFSAGKSGVILEVSDLVKQYAPHITEYYAKNPDIRALLTAPDGKLYSIAADVPKDVNDIVAGTILYRRDWVKKLGLKEPTTVDEWIALWRAFRDKDPNGNGKADEVPFSWGWDSLVYLGTALGLPAPTPNYWPDKNGTVKCVFTSPEYRQLLTIAHRLYAEGLLDKEMGRSEDEMHAMAGRNILGSFGQGVGYLQMLNLASQQGGAPDADWWGATPPMKDGTYHFVKRPPVWNHYGITKAAKDPVLVTRWVDYVWGSDEGVLLNEAGFEGQQYKKTTDGTVIEYLPFVLKNPDGLDMYNALRSLGASDTILIRTPKFIYMAMQKGMQSLELGKTFMPHNVEPFPNLMPTAEEEEVLNTIEPDLDTYRDEMRTKFINGSEPLSGFDAYVKQVEKLRVADLLKVKQSQYDRYVKAMAALAK
jgi:putative aldouronate transport system substrate-binding protein